MTYLLLLVIGMLTGYWWARRNGRIDPTRDKVLSLFRDKSQISNDDVQVALGVSDATATRYLDELERMGVVEQVGSTGAGVVYRRK